MSSTSPVTVSRIALIKRSDSAADLDDVIQNHAEMAEQRQNSMAQRDIGQRKKTILTQARSVPKLPCLSPCSSLHSPNAVTIKNRAVREELEKFEKGLSRIKALERMAENPTKKQIVIPERLKRLKPIKKAVSKTPKNQQNSRLIFETLVKNQLCSFQKTK